jgi:hypothetical protein
VARWPSLEKADHVCKWNVPMASTEAWWKAIANATPPHLKNVTCNAVKQWIHTLTHITYRWELTYEEEKVHCRPVRPTQLTMARRCQSSACSHLAGAFVTGLINPSQRQQVRLTSRHRTSLLRDPRGLVAVNFRTC